MIKNIKAELDIMGHFLEAIVIMRRSLAWLIKFNQLGCIGKGTEDPLA